MAISQHEAAVTAAQADLEGWRQAVAARDARIDELDKVGAHLSRLVVRRERELDELREQIDEVCAQARGYATKVRMQALRQAAAISGERANGNGQHSGEPVVEAEAESGFGVRPAAPADLFEGIVQLEIGPLADFSQLVGFEDAIGAIDATSEVSVTRFSRGRASLDLRLTEPVDLFRELRGRSPLGFTVRGVKDGRLILDLGDEAEAA